MELEGTRSFRTERSLIDGGIGVALNVNDLARIIDGDNLSAADSAVGADTGDLLAGFDRDTERACLHSAGVESEAGHLCRNNCANGSSRNLEELTSRDFHGKIRLLSFGFPIVRARRAQ